MRKTRKEFLKKCSYPDLFAAVLRAGGVDWKTLTAYPDDFTCPAHGCVPGLIYYDDTVSFAKRNIEKIHQMVRDISDRIGDLSLPQFYEDETTYYNYLAWFTWDMMMDELNTYLNE